MRIGKCGGVRCGGQSYRFLLAAGPLSFYRVKAYAVRNAVTVAEVTSTIRLIPVEVELGSEDGLPKRCVANLDTIATIRKDLLVERIAILRDEKVDQINAAIKFALFLP